MSIKGVARFFGRGGKKKKHIITSQTEHKCVLDSCRHPETEGFDVTYLPVASSGLIDLVELEKAIRPDTAIVSIMSVNNEIGVIQPLEEIGKLCRSNKVFFHTDGAQAVGKIPIDVNEWNVDLMSISSHKIYGPKGMGACYVRRRPRVRLDPIITGGGQGRDVVRHQAHQVPLRPTSQGTFVLGAHHTKRSTRLLLPWLRQCLVCLRGRRVATDGAQRHCAVLGQCLHIGLA